VLRFKPGLIVYTIC